jgi:hypothetical protein
MFKTIVGLIKRRLPAGNDIFLALSMAVFLVFSWSLRSMFFTFPSFRLAHTTGDILTIVVYMMAFALVDALGVVFFLVLLAVLLPGGVLKAGFSYKASFFFIASTIVLIRIQYDLTDQTPLSYLALQFGLLILLWLVPVLLTHYIQAVRKVVLDVLDRLTIFTYIYLPIGMVSLLVVIVRLLW